jgi:hypothetical protein
MHTSVLCLPEIILARPLGMPLQRRRDGALRSVADRRAVKATFQSLTPGNLEGRPAPGPLRRAVLRVCSARRPPAGEALSETADGARRKRCHHPLSAPRLHVFSCQRPRRTAHAGSRVMFPSAETLRRRPENQACPSPLRHGCAPVERRWAERERSRGPARKPCAMRRTASCGPGARPRAAASGRRAQSSRRTEGGEKRSQDGKQRLPSCTIRRS